jgi:hypothetical protein
MGLTAGCAVCHDHKFDPISQKEFYEMAAFFNNTTQNAMDGNIKDTPPKVFVPISADRDRWETLGVELTKAREQIAARAASSHDDFERWLAAATPDSLAAMIPSNGLKVQAHLAERSGASDPTPAPAAAEAQPAPAASRPVAPLEIADAGNFEKDQAFSFGAWVKLSKAGLSGSLMARMDDQHEHRGWDLWVENGRIGTHLVHAWPADALKVVSKAEVAPSVWTHVLVTYDGSAKPEGVAIYYNGTRQETDTGSNTLKSTIRTTVPFKVGQRHTTARLADVVALSDLRVYDRSLSAGEVAGLAGASRAAKLLAEPKERRAKEEAEAVQAWWLATIDEPTRQLRGSLQALEQEDAAIRARGTIAHVMQEKGDEAMAYVLFRGEYDKRRDAVKPHTPAALPPMPEDLPRDRLGFAQWLLRPEHPLTARVTVNRFWQELFGQGIVRSAGDFGITGELPSHPELLDWMAVEFRESGWDVKRFYKLLVTSATYRQSAATTPEKLEKDPQNHLLSRGPRFRMDAEMVRDYALAASGLLVSRIGGPSVKPYQPEGVWEAVAMPESNTHFYTPDHGEALYRRSLYTFWKRSAPPASMDIFNAPSREVCTVRRERTNTPLQALVTLNDPQFVEAARTLAQNAMKRPAPSGVEAGVDDRTDRIDFIARRLLARPLHPEELDIVRASLDRLLGYYRAHPDDAARLLSVGESKPDPSLDAPTLAGWTMLANELLNLDEVLNK